MFSIDSNDAAQTCSGSSPFAKNHAICRTRRIIAREDDLAEIDESWLVSDPNADPPLKKFAPEELVTCQGCLRTSPPNRARCMYCGAAFQGAEAAVIPEIQTSIDESKPTFYVVFRGGPTLGTLADTVIDQLAARFHLKPEELRTALSVGAPAPFAAYASEDESQRAVNELRNMGVEGLSVADANLKNDILEMNIHRLEFSDSGVTGVSKNGRERRFASWDDLTLIVTGRLFTHRLEVDERRSRTSVKSLDRRELTQDRSVIDLYSLSCDAPWRIAVNDFDFSCLGERKSLTAFDNARALIELLLDRTHAEHNDAYGRVKAVLANLWPLQNTVSEGRSQRPRAGRNEISRVTASDNGAQFNKYSRLVWRVKVSET